MNKHLVKFLFLILLTPLSGCVGEHSYADTPEGNFEELWKILDEGYCFFDYKQIDWDYIHEIYKEQIYPAMSENELFDTLSQMLNELKDGHVNLMGDSYHSGYMGFMNGYQDNFNWSVLRNYLDTNSRKADDAEYVILRDNIAYVYISNFSETVTYSAMNTMFNYIRNCDGLIIDIRNNGGGTITNATKVASCFTDKKILSGYILHKTGKGRNDFSAPQPIYLNPSSDIIWLKNVVVLTNRRTYSAANHFVNVMKCLPHVTIIGDTSGGGSGLPFTSELPNGWQVRFSASPILSIKKEHTEFGVEPDIHVDMEEEDEKKGVDTIIESACTFLLK
ncbi:S41 family peptidase [Bacteroides sp. 224]|uniref:S41 family peptidase n=1 Tax=Bacteroides sp. 224 TaxID=2302936 RepID=UPI0013D01F2B|nr:S41 family peptidase [Bacteroides sp. 224]NDV64152.1 peptidase S41 [Bacteroides sp. 224]